MPKQLSGLEVTEAETSESQKDLMRARLTPHLQNITVNETWSLNPPFFFFKEMSQKPHE